MLTLRRFTMQATLKFLIAALFVGASLGASANDAHHPAEGKAVASKPAQAEKPTAKAANEQMQKLRAARDKLATAKTPAERQMAMQESMSVMKGAMQAMHKDCMSKGMGKGMNHDGDMMEMMMQMMDQQSSMMSMPMNQ
ncbi:hypothetical protein [Andreprevotia lacus]|nr:hypothetical protein [Andreprevotia lacus]